MVSRKLFGKFCFHLLPIYLIPIVSFLFPTLVFSNILHVPSQYSSMQEALMYASDWDTIFVAQGTYPGIRYIGTSESPEWITLMGSWWPNGTIITASPLNQDHNAFTVKNVCGWRITNFEIANCGDAIHPHGFTKGEIDHNYMHGMYMAYWSCAIEGDSLDGTSIHHNLVTDCDYGGFFIGRYNDQREIHIYNNTISNIYGYEGIQFLNGVPQNCVITNNIITNCAGQGVEFANCSQGNTQVSYNCIFMTNGPWQNVPNPGTGNIFVSPQFLMEPTIPEYYYLDEESPCIDTGNPHPYYNDPNGTRSDMGAFPSGLVFIDLEIEWTTGFPGDTVLVPINISDVTGLDVVSSEFVITFPDDDLELLSMTIPDSSLPFQAGWVLSYNEINGTIIGTIEGSTSLTGSGLYALMTYVLSESALPDSVWNICFNSALLNNGAYEPRTINGGIRLPFEILYGDVNLNSHVTLHDASLLFDYLTGGQELSFLQQHVAEVSDQMGITAYDGALITQYCFEQFPLFPVEGGIVEMYAEGILSIPETPVYAGEEAEIPVMVQNAINVAGAEMEVTLGGVPVVLTGIIGPGQGAWFSRVSGEYPDYDVFLGGSEAIHGNQQLCCLRIEIPDSLSGMFSILLSGMMLNETEIAGQEYREFNIQLAGVHGEETLIPEKFDFDSVYPNPFNPLTNLVFSIPTMSQVRLTIYNSLGQVVEVIESGMLPAGRYSRMWDATGYSSGIYIAELVAGANRQYQKLLLIK